ncbi:putative ABC transporter ATP-binding protein YheS [Clostridium acetireducens DSM 10703]|uniref:Putative ABC transporter ATP-binding protein YheS n=1 Tax=Clostridium acetireducens DSM 10703 TaxID=1121290 RepID=A0A1E8F1D6_9CLOT|nr:ABC-F family ATP-binding cassette domain-containing protein [Clostridium acetireducens]OFI07420.1 putative ABC transporter ATP-binding protein YheS [Clostridium acetireducens DSM 10703]
MIVLSCKNINKSYGIDSILKNITFHINEGEKIGLIGANGVGKSTLFKIIANQIDYDSGDLFVDKSKKIGYLSQHLSLDSNNTIYDELLLVFKSLLNLEKKINKLEKSLSTSYDSNNMSYYEKLIKNYTLSQELYNNRGGYTYKAKISKVLNGLGFSQKDYEKPINILSGGQKTRVALCKLLLINPDILLLDEPTNHLDLDAIEWLEDYLKTYKGTMLIISHDRFFLDSVTNKTFELTNSHIKCYNGNYSSYIKQKEENYESELKAYNIQQSEIKRQEKIIEKYKSFNREKSIKAAESRQKALDKIERLDKPLTEKQISHMNFQVEIKSGNDILHIENLKKQFNDKLLFHSVNLDIKRGEKTALIGENGGGKTTLFKIIMDKEKASDGVKVLGKNIYIGYYDQEQSNLDINKTVIDEIWDDFPELTTTEIRTALASFLFTGDDVFKKISSLSGGEKCKINLLKLILSKSNFLLLDEPTNHLDIMSREALEKALLNYDGTLLIISHDRYFLNKVINKIYELHKDGINLYLGNYSYYKQKKKNPLRFNYEEISNTKTKTQIEKEKKKKKEEQKFERQKKAKIKKIEDNISNLENNITSLQEQLCLEEVYSNPEKSEEVNKNIISLQKKLDELYEIWENLM